VVLIQYLALGGGLVDGDGQPTLEGERLSQALAFFQQARRAGTIPRSVLELSDTTTAWATFRIGEAAMVQVPASLFLAERAGLSNVSFGPVPLSDPGFMTVGRGWALAVVTKEPQRQELAAALIEHLLAPENNGTWTRAAARLPTGNAALNTWDQEDAYVPFVRSLLTQAEPAPNPDVAAVVGAPMAQALTEVLSGNQSPTEAAEAAVGVVESSE
jgi:ABC-type glycerol-3-phosphate transport system substrate-binding protein